MTRPTFLRHTRAWAFAVSLVLLASGLDAVGSALPIPRLFSIEPAATWVGIARVHLEIDDLRQAGERLEGTYRIRVPLAPAQNDTGRITLLAPAGLLDDLGVVDQTVVGNALSSSGQVNDVIARIRPNGVVRIEVTTPARTLRFKSRYAKTS